MKEFVSLLPFFLSLFFQNSDKLPASVSFTVGGDMMFDRLIAKNYKGDNLPRVLSQLKDSPPFSKKDVVLVNLEGPVSEKQLLSDSNPDRLIFNFPPETVGALKYLGINGVSLANNHTLNAGNKGLSYTREILTKSGITPVGGPNSADPLQIASFSGTGLNFVVIGVNTFTHPVDITSLIRQIKSQPGNRVLVFPHWGVEYKNTHSSSQQKLAYSWIDAGADLIIGSHPHVIQDAEVYKNHPVIYSVGNLLFDQTFSPLTQIGLIITGIFTSRGLQLTAVPIKSVNLQPEILSGQEKQTILDRFYQPFSSYLSTPSAETGLFFPVSER
jgi:poly-gamma-glutamate synthesis protein (capsule biosynthesis protein)